MTEPEKEVVEISLQEMAAILGLQLTRKEKIGPSYESMILKELREIKDAIHRLLRT